MNPKEALVFFLPIVVVLGALLVSFWAMMKDTRKHKKERYEHGKERGRSDSTRHRLRESLQNSR